MSRPADWSAPRKATLRKRTLSQKVMRYVALPLLLLVALLFTGMFLGAQYPNAFYTHASRIAFGYVFSPNAAELPEPPPEPHRASTANVE